MDNNGQCLWCDNFVPRISGGLAASSRPGVVNAQHPDPSFVANLVALLGKISETPKLWCLVLICFAIFIGRWAIAD